MPNLPADVVSQSLDAIGSDLVVGDMENGSREAQVCLRAYTQCIRQLLRCAHWDFSRKSAPMTMLGDATGQTAGTGATVPSGWIYEYAYPQDCVKARFVPQNYMNAGAPAGNNALSSAPIMTGLGNPVVPMRTVPARFLVATDFNYPSQIAPGQPWWEMQGVAPGARTVILTNVNQAQLVYTAYVKEINLWDALFRSAFVAYLAQEIALPLTKDKKFGLQLRKEQIEITKQKIMQARISDGNEGWYNSDFSTDWMRARRTGGSWRGAGQGGMSDLGILWGGFDQLSFSDGSAY